MSLIVSHPEVAYRTCEDCKKWMYDPQTGELKRHGQPINLPLERPRGVPPPCCDCPKCRWIDRRERNPEEGKRSELSARNWLTLERYYEQQATGGTVDDIARRNFGIIHQVLTDASRENLQAMTTTLTILARRQ